ncbi:MAG: hypothetical protein JNK05_02275 [Myxococcales bacterium]|nr:hypothetical protein [Myxococcales bacterium]
MSHLRPLRTLVASVAATLVVSLVAHRSSAQSTSRVTACAAQPAQALTSAMLRDGATVRFSSRISRAPAACAYRTTRNECIAMCRSHGIASGQGATVHLRGGAVECATTNSSTSKRCPFSDNQTLTVEGTLRRLGNEWWLDVASACRQ